MFDDSGPNQLIYLFSKLPGLGTRSARRIVLHLLQNKNIRLRGLIEGLKEAESKIHVCKICKNLDYDEICRICSDEKRQHDSIAIVETVADLWAIERANVFKGKYHVIGNSLNEINLTSADDIGLPRLASRCRETGVSELIIATNSTLDGQTVAFFISEYFKDLPIRTTRLASGIPIGGELDYLDEGTLSAALAKREGI